MPTTLGSITSTGNLTVFTETSEIDFSVLIPQPEIEYTTAGNYNFIVPDGITSISAVLVGGGGGSAWSGQTVIVSGAGGGGGGGGGLRYVTNLTVTPGETLTVVVGAGGTGGNLSFNGAAGGDSAISRSGNVLIFAGGGAGGGYAGIIGNSAGVGGTGGNGSIVTGNIGGGNGGTGGSQSLNTGGGGGGAVEDDTTLNGRAGGAGAVRIIWGVNRYYPSTGTGNVGNTYYTATTNSVKSDYFLSNEFNEVGSLPSNTVQRIKGNVWYVNGEIVEI
jgi:hypothetical protein